MSEVLLGYIYIENIVCSFVVSGTRNYYIEWINPADIPLVESNVILVVFPRVDNLLDERNAP